MLITPHISKRVLKKENSSPFRTLGFVFNEFCMKFQRKLGFFWVFLNKIQGKPLEPFKTNIFKNEMTYYEQKNVLT